MGVKKKNKILVSGGECAGCAGWERECVMLRTKLEVRTWILRFAVALDAFFIANTIWKR